MFGVFSTQVYYHSILSNSTFGGACYIATGRGFTTARAQFGILYSFFAGQSIYLGMRMSIMLLCAMIAMWIPHLIYFWVKLSLFVWRHSFSIHVSSRSQILSLIVDMYKLLG